MWPKWNDRTVAVIARHAIAIGGAGGRAGGHGESLAAAAPTGMASAEAAIDAFAAIERPAAARRVGRRVDLWIDDDWTRLFGATWPESIPDLHLFKAYVAARFEQRFELSASDWTIVTPGAWPGLPVLCVATPTALIERLRDAAGRVGLIATSLAPLSLGEVAAAISTRPRTAAVFVGSVAPRRTVLLLRGARLADCVVVPDGEGVVSLAEAIFDARGLLPRGLRWSLRLEQSRAQATEYLLARRRLPAIGTEHPTPDDRAPLVHAG